MTTLNLFVLGKPLIQLSGRSLPGLVSRKSQALLFYLAYTGQPHSRQALAGLLWSEMDEERARRNLRVALSRMKEDLADYLVVQRRTLAFNKERPYWLDVVEFETTLKQKELSIDELKQATDLYSGPFLDDFNLRDAPLFEEWMRLQQEHYRQLAMDGLYRLSALQTETRQFSEGIATLNRLLMLEPWMEEAHRQLMLLLAVSGQRSAALAQYETCAAMLDEELGVAPASETTTLYQKIRAEELDGLLPHLTIVSSPAPKVVPPPFQVPATVPHFVGRMAQQQAIIEALQAADKVTAVQAIVGMGGVGKSTLAAQIAAQLQGHFPDGVLWANAATSEPMSVLESWAQLYGYDFSAVGDVESMAAAFRSALADKRVLLVLDDVTSAARIRPLLPSGPHCRVLLTLRDQDLARALNAQVWQLRELSAENGRLLFRNILGETRIAAEPDAADAICDELANLPLAVEITAQRLKSRPRRKLADLAQRLRDEKERLSLLTISDREVRASFALSWETLDSDLKRVFALLGLFGGRSFAAEAVARLAEMDSYLLEDKLYALVALSLLREEGQTRYQLHPLLADFAREQLGEDVAGEVNGRFAHYYLHFAQQNQTDYDALRPEWDNLMAAMEAAHTHQLHQTVIDFADALNDAWFKRGRYTQARQAFTWSTLAAEKEDDKFVAAQNFRQLGLAALEQRDFEDAAKYLDRSLKLCEKFNAPIILVGQNRRDLARIEVERANYVLAEQHLEASGKICKQQNDLVNLAETLHVQARLYYFQGKIAQTIELGLQVIDLLNTNGKPEKTVRTLSLLASAFFTQNQFDAAKSHAQKALQLSEQYQEKGDKGVILGLLAYISQWQDDLEAAQTYAEQSLSLLQTLGDLGSQALTYYQLGGIYLAQNKLHQALQTTQKSLSLCEQSEFTLQKGWTLTQLATCYEQLGDASQAQVSWQEAELIAETLKNPVLQESINHRRAGQ